LSFGNQLNTEFVLIHVIITQVADKIILSKACSTHSHLDIPQEIYSEKDEIFDSMKTAINRAIELKNSLQSQIIEVCSQDYPKYLPCLVVIE
jgi:hypothetical protein